MRSLTVRLVFATTESRSLQQQQFWRFVFFGLTCNCHLGNHSRLCHFFVRVDQNSRKACRESHDRECKQNSNVDHMVRYAGESVDFHSYIIAVASAICHTNMSVYASSCRVYPMSSHTMNVRANDGFMMEEATAVYIHLPLGIEPDDRKDKHRVCYAVVAHACISTWIRAKAQSRIGARGMQAGIQHESQREAGEQREEI